MALNRRELPSSGTRSQAFPAVPGMGGRGGPAVPHDDPPPQGGGLAGTADQPGRSPVLVAVPVPGTADELYACPWCRQLDYRPLDEDRRCCLCCGHVYRDVEDRLNVDRGLPKQAQVIVCPDCGGKPYSPGPDGLPQRRCHGCGRVWRPE
jgi:hypothetical protein